MSIKLILNQLKNRPILKKILKNIGWLSFDRFFQLGVSFFVGIWMARYLGPSEFGIFNFIIALGTLILPFLGLGVSNLLVRELVRYPEKKYQLMGTSFFIYFTTCLISFFLLVGMIAFLRPNDSLAFFVAIIFYLGNLFAAFDLIGGWFDSKIESKTVVFYKNIALSVSAIAKIYFIFFGFPLIYFVFATFLETLLRSILMIYAYQKDKQNILLWKVDFKIAKELVKSSWPLMFSGLMIMIYMRIDQVMIGLLLNDSQVGLYSAAVKISELVCFLPSILLSSLFPSLVLMKEKSTQRYLALFQRLFDFLVWFAIFLIVPICFFSGPIIFLLYGIDYLPATATLTILTLALLAIFLKSGVDSYLINAGLTKIVLVNSFLGAFSNVILNLILIPILGINGAAIATVISYIIALLGIVLFKETRIVFFMVISSFNPKAAIKRNISVFKKLLV